MTDKQEVKDGIDTGSAGDEGDNLPVLEQKYQQQMRQIVTQKIELPVAALPEMLKNQIKLNPEFQRRERWDEVRQSRFIESIIMNVPVPPVFLGEDDYGHYVVLDGRQRLTALSKFLANLLTLKRLGVWEELNGLKYDDMGKRGFDKYLVRRFLPAVVILKESSPIVKYDVFDRLNTGGVTANDMEIRNALYRGKFTDLLHKLSRVPEFCGLWDIPTDNLEAESKNRLYQEMGDLALVLRFFALSEHDQMKIKFRDFLSEFMDQRNRAYEADGTLVERDQQRFLQAVKNSWHVFGDRAFVRPTGSDGIEKRSVPYSDAVMIALSDVPSAALGEPQVERIKQAFRGLLSNHNFLAGVSSGTNGKGAIETRIRLAQEATNDALAAA